VTKSARRGPSVGEYFTRYSDLRDLRFVPGTLDGRSVIAVFAPKERAHPTYFILLDFEEDRVSSIRDFRYVHYIADEVALGRSVFEADDA